MQALRSASNWSLGRLNTESSIYACYCELIKNAQSYIFIENQFFISSTSKTGVENQIGNALIERIIRAIREKKAFKVIIFMPLMPAFEANLEDHQGKVMQIQIALQNHSIYKGEDSVIAKIVKEIGSSGGSPDDYIMFCSLRKWENRPSDNVPITELIYIHSKLMIVDDNVLIVGSANINDRSLLGSRDSEIGICIDGQPDKQVNSGNGSIGVVAKIHDLRKKIFF